MRLSVPRRRPSCWAPCDGGSSAGPHGQGELLVASSSPHSCRALPSAAATMTTLVWCGEGMTRTTPTSRSNPPALGVSPLHDGSGDGSSSEETPRSPAFRFLIRLSFRSRLAIWRSLCCALHVAHCLSATALFRLKIASSGRGALAGMRWVHFNWNDKKEEKSARVEGLREDRHHNKNTREASRR
jgi:hypothetical protein